MPLRLATPCCAGRSVTMSPGSAGRCCGSSPARKIYPLSRRTRRCRKQSHPEKSPFSSSAPSPADSKRSHSRRQAHIPQDLRKARIPMYRATEVNGRNLQVLAAHVGEAVDDLIGHAVAEEVGLRVAAEILTRQDGDRMAGLISLGSLVGKAHTLEQLAKARLRAQAAVKDRVNFEVN